MSRETIIWLADIVRTLYSIFLASAFGFSLGGLYATEEWGWAAAAGLSGLSLSSRLLAWYICPDED